MYVIIRTMKIEKGYLDKILERFKNNKGPIFKSPGFVKREVLVQTKNKEYDTLIVKIFFLDKKAFYVWEGSEEHIALHKDTSNEHNHKPEGIIEATREAFELVLIQNHD